MNTVSSFITFEGGEGAGKTTQIKRLGERLTDAGIDHLTTREPGGTRGAEAIRSLVVSGDVERWDSCAEALLMMAARRDHVERAIKPALKEGRWVLCDRFQDSTIAYQGYGGGVPVEDLKALYRIAIGKLRPTLTVILDIPVSEGLARAKVRDREDLITRAFAEDRFERMNLDFHNMLRESFLTIAKEDPERCVVIDARPSPDEVHQAIVEEISHRLGVKL